jgi:23S rRNA (guanosine2251-2'-O)-methyltransferase
MKRQIRSKKRGPHSSDRDIRRGEVLFGFHPVFEAMQAGRRSIETIFLADEKRSARAARIENLAVQKGLSIQRIASSKLEELSAQQIHKGIGAKVAPYPLATLDDILQSAGEPDRESFVLLLDGIKDPQNLGAILRTALCAGVHGVVIPKDRCAQPTPTVSKASAGALEHIRLARVTNMVNIIKELKREGLWIVGTDAGAPVSIFDSDLGGPLALVIGGEEKGIRPLVKKNCDFLFSIPQVGRLNSLNASAAAAVALYEIFRRKRA